MRLARIFLQDTDGIQVETITFTFRKPQNRFVPPAESVFGMKAVAKCPHNSIAQANHRIARHHLVNQTVQRRYHSHVYMISNLPTDTAAGADNAKYFWHDRLQLRQELLSIRIFLVRFTHAVRWRGDYQVDRSRR